MRNVMPPLNLSRSFEAVARQLSFGKAAGELHLAPGAVSQQIRALQRLFGAKLFNRTGGSVALTEGACECCRTFRLVWTCCGRLARAQRRQRAAGRSRSAWLHLLARDGCCQGCRISTIRVRTSTCGSWQFARARHLRATHGKKFTLAERAMQAAIDGLGVMLGRVVLAEGDLAARRLVRRLALALPQDVSYFLVWSAPRKYCPSKTGCLARCGRATMTCHRPTPAPQIGKTRYAKHP
jgi:DNA-binding transcriptional LysR family regulator